MYMGHLAVALGAKRLTSKLPLWVLLLASLLPDLVDAFAGLTPWGRFANEYSHSLYGIVVMVMLMVFVAALLARDVTEALLAGALVASHLLLDFVTSHISLWSGGPLVGAGLYSHPLGDFVAEAAVIVISVWVYSQSLKVRLGRPAVLGMLSCLIVFQAAWDAMLLAGG